MNSQEKKVDIFSLSLRSTKKETPPPRENDHKGNHYYEEPKDVFNNISTIHPNKLDDDKDILNESFFEGNKEEMLNLDLVSYCVQQYSSKKKENKKVEKTNKRGRPKKGEIKNGKHRYYEEDNIIRKIKAHFYKYVNKTLEKTIINKWHKFHKIPYVMVNNLEKEYNNHLMNSTIREIYQESLSYNKKSEDSEYREDKRNDRNEKTLNYLSKPENQEKEKEVINLLNLNSIQFFEIFKMKNKETFLNELSIKYDKGYLDKVKNLCYNFEKWFLDKSGRTRGKK